MLIAASRLASPMVRAGVRSPLPLLPVIIGFPVVYAVVRSLSDIGFAVTLTVIIGAACAAYAVDDRAEPSLSPCPVSRLARRSFRLLLVVAVVTAGWGIAALALASSDRSPGPLVERIPETAAVAAIALAVASRASLAGTDGAATVGAVVSLISVGVSTGLGIVLTWLPQLDNPTDRTSWTWVAVAALAAAAWWSRDPATPTRIPLRGEFGASRRAST